MKILQIYELAPLDRDAYTGIDVAILELSKHLSKLGHEVTILTGAGRKKHADIDGIKVIPVDFAGLMRRTWNPVNLKFFRQLTFPLIALKEKLDGYDIYHGHIYTSGLLAVYLARRNGAKAVNTIHGSYYPVWGELASPLSAGFYKVSERILAPLLTKLCDLQIHTGKYFAEQVVKWGGARDAIKVIYNGIDAKIFNPGVLPAEFSKNSMTIFTARRLVKKNGVRYLIEALSYVLKEKDCHLLIAGDGPERAALESLAKRLGIAEHVTFLGLVSHERIPRYISLADIIVIPSIIEASSLFMLEAMAMAKPVVATRTGGIPEIIGNENGMLVAPMSARELAEKILLLYDPATRKRLGENAYRDAMQFTWGKVAERTEKEYLRILGK